jgi:predicted metal-dependent hydrolase
LPYFVPYQTAVGFVSKHIDWIKKELSRHTAYLPDGMSIGRAHVLRYVPDPRVKTPTTRVTAAEVIVRHGAATHEDDHVQTAAKRAAVRALKNEATHFLPKRLHDIAYAEGYDFSGVSVKQMRSRWGSCNQDKHITLNIFLLELPIELIDYVIMHELAHTRALNHGAEFWREFEAHLPGARNLRKQIRQYHPAIPALRMA